MKEICELCGIKIPHPKEATRYCPKCSEQRLRDNAIRANLRYRQKKAERERILMEKKLEEKRKMPSIAKMNAIAREEGVSYGTIQARETAKQVKIVKPAGWKGKCCI